jgi:probable F420-dependent oxidoreductase
LDFGIHLGSVSPKAWVDVVRQADRVGFESVWLPEHLVIPVSASGSPHHGAEHPPIPAHVPVFDVFAYLAHLAAVTERITLGTSVYNIGLRHPFVTARAATTVDVLSGGRLALGIGSSWLREEWEAVGLDFDTRGARVDEAIDVCRRLWTEETIEHHGEFFDFAPVAFEPKPVQAGGPALHIGGDGAIALRRTATVGTGWIPMNHTVEQLGPPLAKLRELCVALGRTTPVQVTLHGDVQRPEDVERYAEAGVTRLIVTPFARTSEAIDGLARFADEVISPLR